jgi:hypothetical protein
VRHVCVKNKKVVLVEELCNNDVEVLGTLFRPVNLPRQAHCLVLEHPEVHGGSPVSPEDQVWFDFAVRLSNMVILANTIRHRHPMTATDMLDGSNLEQSLAVLTGEIDKVSMTDPDRWAIHGHAINGMVDSVQNELRLAASYFDAIMNPPAVAAANKRFTPPAKRR